MPLKQLEIAGFRGFANAESLYFAQPTGREGSGLTILVGPNNAGKSTVLEALHLLQRSDSTTPAFGEGRRNAAARGRVHVQFRDDHTGQALLATNPGGGGAVSWRGNTLNVAREAIFIVPPRRAQIGGSFAYDEADRKRYSLSLDPNNGRANVRPNFAPRLVRMHNRREAVDQILARVLDEVPEWTVEPLTDRGDHALRIYTGQSAHPGDGIGDGFASLLLIADALYDSEPGDVIVIDEPELSLHPAAQRRLAAVLSDSAKDRQIVYATHCPYFAEWDVIFQGAAIARVYQGDGGSRIRNLGVASIELARRLADNHANPHILGTDAREVFFLSDGVVLVEGQEDVVGYRILERNFNESVGGAFFGWGVGGAGNMRIVASILRDLGFDRVVGVVDADKKDVADTLSGEFPEFRFLVSPYDDVRCKEARRASAPKPGLLDAHWVLPPERRESARRMLRDIQSALRQRPAGSNVVSDGTMAALAFQSSTDGGDN